MIQSSGLPDTTWPGGDLPPGPAGGLEEWLAWQERVHGNRIMLGLERCRQVARELGLLGASAQTVISVAGTNGKGSSVHMLESILHHAGYKVGAYTSPHLCRYNERIRINGVPAAEAALCACFHEVESARGTVPLTYFEFGTLAALLMFRAQNVEIALLEVGLGGRLDAVNVLDADFALITAIGIDHAEWLGRTRESIGREKAGILRAGRPVVCSDPNPPGSIRRHAESMVAPLYLAGHDFEVSCHAQGWDFRSGTRVIERLPLPHPYSSCQVHNAAGVLMVLELLAKQCPVQESAVRAGLHGACPPGRFQLVPGELPLVLDVAHNPQAAQELGRSLRTLKHSGRLHVVIGMLRDKDHEKVMAELAPYADTWHLVDTAGERGCTAAYLAEVLARTVPHPGAVHLWPHVEAALESLRGHPHPEDRVLVTGSFVIVGSVLDSL